MNLWQEPWSANLRFCGEGFCQTGVERSSCTTWQWLYWI